MRATLKNRRAFSLLEVLIAIVLLAAVIIYFILAFGIGKYTIQLSKERLVVSNLLRETMETILASSYSTIDTMVGSQAIAVNDGLKTFSTTRTIDVQTIDPAIYGYKKVYIKIEWVGGATRNKILSEDMAMYVTKK